MKARRPLGTIRPLATMLGGGRRRWRGGPLVPMIWRRRPRARAEPERKAARPLQAHIFNLSLIWPAGVAARAEPVRHLETRLHHVLGAPRNAGILEKSRLVTLVERLWLRPDNHGGRASAPGVKATQPAGTDGAPAGSNDLPVQGIGNVSAPAAPRLWPRASRMVAARTPGLQYRAIAIRHGTETTLPAKADEGAGRAPAATIWRAAAARVEVPEGAPRRPLRRRAPLIWRKEAEAGDAFAPAFTQGFGRRPSTDLVWRRPAPGADAGETGASPRSGESAPWRNEIGTRADRPMAPSPTPAAPPPAAAVQPAEMNRLVDEVVRRLDRIGRDERMRRGL